MKKFLSFLSLVLVSSISFAGDRSHRDYVTTYHGYCDNGRHYGYYRNSHNDLSFGLIGFGIGAAIFSERPVYIEKTIYVEKPQIVYVSVPAVVEITQTTIAVQNSNGSFTPVLLNKVNGKWVGPKGEYYDTIPTVGQLRPIYGF